MTTLHSCSPLLRRLPGSSTLRVSSFGAHQRVPADDIPTPKSFSTPYPRRDRIPRVVHIHAATPTPIDAVAGTALTPTDTRRRRVGTLPTCGAPSPGSGSTNTQPVVPRFTASGQSVDLPPGGAAPVLRTGASVPRELRPRPSPPGFWESLGTGGGSPTFSPPRNITRVFGPTPRFRSPSWRPKPQPAAPRILRVAARGSERPGVMLRPASCWHGGEPASPCLRSPQVPQDLRNPKGSWAGRGGHPARVRRGHRARELLPRSVAAPPTHHPRPGSPRRYRGSVAR